VIVFLFDFLSLSLSLSSDFNFLISLFAFCCSSGPTTGQDMVSRRRILSRSRDDLHLDNFPEEEDDVWHIKEKLYKVRTTETTSFTFLFLHVPCAPMLRCQLNSAGQSRGTLLRRRFLSLLSCHSSKSSRIY